MAENDPEINLKADLDTPAYQRRFVEVCIRCEIPSIIHADRTQDEEEVDEQPRTAAGAA